MKTKSVVSCFVAVGLAASAFAGLACKDPYTYHVSNESCIAASCASGGTTVTGYRVGGSSGITQGGCSETSRHSAYSCDKVADPVWQTRYDQDPNNTYECNDTGTLVSTTYCIDTSGWVYPKRGFSTTQPCNYCTGE